MSSMSSRILVGEEGPARIRPIVWRKSSQSGVSQSSLSELPARFEPSVSIDHETATLRNRLLEMEQSGRQAVETTRRQAFAEGEAQGRAQSSAELAPILARQAKSLEELAALRPRLREEAESDVVQLSLAIARRILHRELSIDPGAIQALVQVALDRLARQEIYRVRVHPAQADAVRASLQSGHVDFELQVDPRLDSGALVFETNRGKMDASVTAQLDEIERGLTDRVQQR